MKNMRVHACIYTYMVASHCFSLGKLVKPASCETPELFRYELKLQDYLEKLQNLQKNWLYQQPFQTRLETPKNGKTSFVSETLRISGTPRKVFKMFYNFTILQS